jgi:hypothetical protein
MIAGRAVAGDMEVEGAIVVAVMVEVEADMEDILADIIVLGQEDQAEAEITIEEETNDKDFTNPYIYTSNSVPSEETNGHLLYIKMKILCKKNSLYISVINVIMSQYYFLFRNNCQKEIKML